MRSVPKGASKSPSLSARCATLRTKAKWILLTTSERNKPVVGDNRWCSVASCLRVQVSASLWNVLVGKAFESAVAARHMFLYQFSFDVKNMTPLKILFNEQHAEWQTEKKCKLILMYGHSLTWSGVVGTLNETQSTNRQSVEKTIQNAQIIIVNQQQSL